MLCILALPACAALLEASEPGLCVPRHCLSQLSLIPQSDLIKGRREKWSELDTGALCAAVSAIITQTLVPGCGVSVELEIYCS